MARDRQLDIHNTKYRINLAEKTIMEKFPANGKTVCRFLERLRFENKSPGRIANHADLQRESLQ